MADLSELLERVKAATGPDDDLDYSITQFVDPGAIRHSSAHLHYTGSIDDALALVERMLGVDASTLCYSFDLGWHASAHAHMAFTADLHLAVGNPADMQSSHGQAATLPLAILVALLTALSTQEPSHD